MIEIYRLILRYICKFIGLYSVNWYNYNSLKYFLLLQDTSVDLKGMSENSLDSRKNVEIVNNTATILVSPETLDYAKIKIHLKSKDTRTKLLLLQALHQVFNIAMIYHKS